jgi:hypothetical protein
MFPSWEQASRVRAAILAKMRGLCAVVLVSGLAQAGPMGAVGHGMSGSSLFKDLAIGPTVGGSALWEPGGFGGRLSLGLGLAVFHPTTERHGAMKFSALIEGEVQLAPGTYEGSVFASGSPISWRWFSFGACAGVGVKGTGPVAAWTIRLGPEVAATLHHAWGNFDGVMQIFVRGSFPVLRPDVFSSQVLLGVRVFIDLT